jgi:hypothetical protein
MKTNVIICEYIGITILFVGDKRLAIFEDGLVLSVLNDNSLTVDMYCSELESMAIKYVVKEIE